MYDDVIQHRAFALEKNSLFVGRKELLSTIVTKASDFCTKKPIVVHGQLGKKLNTNIQKSRKSDLMHALKTF